MIFNTHYAYGVGVSGAVIVVTAPTGSTVTATLDGVVYNAQEVKGAWTFKVRKFGTYTVTATLGNQTASKTVEVTEKKTYEVTLTYTLSVSISGTVSASSYYCFVKINNVIYGNYLNDVRNVPANITITQGTEIQVGMSGSSYTEPSTCTINGRQVISADSGITYYTFTPTGNCTIVMNRFPSGGGNTITITY